MFNVKKMTIVFLLVATSAFAAIQTGINPGWDIFGGGGSYRYGASMFGDGTNIYCYFAGPGQNGAWDYIYYWYSNNNGNTWRDQQITLQPTPGSEDALSCCDPGAFYYGGHVYIGYTSTQSTDGYRNKVYIARSNGSVNGPWYKWN